MNKFTKKNFMLVAILAGSGVVAVALLIVAGIVWFDLLQRINDTKVAREKVEKLSLRRGQTLVMLSDGAGGEEILRECWVCAGEPAGELAARILESGGAVSGDDATVAVVRLRSAPVST